MKVLESNAGLLSNLEVLELLQKRGAAKGPLGGSISPAEYKVYEFLVDTPAGTQTRAALEEFVKEVKVFKLTEAERLQSVNLRPATAVEVHLIVEDCDERLSGEQVDSLIETVDRVLPSPPEKPEAEEEEAKGEEDEELDEAEEGSGAA
ncbi:DNA-directed RNA polymerase III subunit RPC9 [Marchantia polymorpha subsp. ruderalis]|uniref:DNA-directed RNA polymerase III subunit RPC9 n=2 Tax=Marchantia polymorpha TaxID=3197 RepID=A0AAF6BCF3_MARPO|nr:hypothetical protein MARPO_0090s0037 [Marchantia polymorpha]BBN09687.1 hypothetical protein Mp_4g21850 [Marchantia polymorpha subsp. ruderalis]|eukprot:PTQ33300.1 hypothetical protein MARPO_0090s0037 [Marchantia polymorpha]